MAFSEKKAIFPLLFEASFETKFSVSFFKFYSLVYIILILYYQFFRSSDKQSARLNDWLVTFDVPLPSRGVDSQKFS